jgi:hypothetical protein
MPQSTQIAAFILGAVLLLIAVLGGGFTIFGAGVPGRVSTTGRLLAFVLSVVFFALGLIGLNNKTPNQSQAYQPTGPPNQTATPSASSSQPEQQAAELKVRSPENSKQVIDIGGYWEDESKSIMHIIQRGEKFDFTISNNIPGSSANGSSATGHGTIGSSEAAVEFTATRIISGKPVISQASGKLKYSGSRGLQGYFVDNVWGEDNHFYLKK